MNYELFHEGNKYSIDVKLHKDSYLVTLNGIDNFKVKVKEITENSSLLSLNGETLMSYVVQAKERTYVNVNGCSFVFEQGKRATMERKTGAGGIEETFVASPMPGTIVKISAKQNQKVKKGEVLVIVEAMKMENELRSSMDGIVKRIRFSKGDQVDAGKPIVELEKLQKGKNSKCEVRKCS